MNGLSNRRTPSPSMEASESPEVEAQKSKCTVARAKSIIKTIFAQLFSHVGLCLLVVGYSLLGAVIFVALEKEHEMSIRKDVGEIKSGTLNELYNLTAFLRLEVILQEEKIHKLRESVSHLTDLNRKCDRLRRKDRKFLIDLIETTKRDNVPLTHDACETFCKKHSVKKCEELCSPKLVRCSHWPDSSKCLKLLQNADKNNAKNIMQYSSDHENNNPSNSVVMKRDTSAQDIVLTNTQCEQYQK